MSIHGDKIELVILWRTSDWQDNFNRELDPKLALQNRTSRVSKDPSFFWIRKCHENQPIFAQVNLPNSPYGMLRPVPTVASCWTS